MKCIRLWLLIPLIISLFGCSSAREPKAKPASSKFAIGLPKDVEEIPTVLAFDSTSRNGHLRYGQPSTLDLLQGLWAESDEHNVDFIIEGDSLTYFEKSETGPFLIRIIGDTMNIVFSDTVVIKRVIVSLDERKLVDYYFPDGDTVTSYKR